MESVGFVSVLIVLNVSAVLIIGLPLLLISVLCNLCNLPLLIHWVLVVAVRCPVVVAPLHKILLLVIIRC